MKSAERSLWLELLNLVWELAQILASFVLFVYLIVALGGALLDGRPVTNTVLLIGILYLGMAMDRVRSSRAAAPGAEGDGTSSSPHSSKGR